MIHFRRRIFWNRSAGVVAQADRHCVYTLSPGLTVETVTPLRTEDFVSPQHNQGREDGDMSRRARLLLSTGAFVLALITAGPVPAATIWSSSLTVRALSRPPYYGLFGCAGPYAQNLCGTLLTDATFTHDNVDYTIVGFYVLNTDSLGLRLDKRIAQGVRELILHVDGRQFAFPEAATYYDGDEGVRWRTPDLRWATNQQVSLSLRAQDSSLQVQGRPVPAPTRMQRRAASPLALTGGRGPDDLKGGSGDDTLKGKKGADVLRGLDGDDTLYGGKGRDRLLPGNGNDDLSGGPGPDRFVFVSGETGDNIIADFEDGDLIVLKGGGFPPVADIVAGVVAEGSQYYVYTLQPGLSVETNVGLDAADFSVR